MSTQEQNTPTPQKFEIQMSQTREVIITPPRDYIPTARIVTTDGEIIYLVCGDETLNTPNQ